MTRAVILALFACSIMSAPVAAQSDGPALPSGVVEACLAGTAPGDLDPDCIGEAADQCQQAPGGSTTRGIAGCLMAEHDAWDAVLNAQYQETRAAFADDDTASASLRDAQRAWIAWRDAECRFEYDRYGDGSMRSVSAAGCRMTLTARRALELRAKREW